MAESAWKKQLQDFGVEEDVIAAIITWGFKRDARFVNAIIDSDALEGWLKRLKAKVASACVLPDDEWLSSAMCGNLRALWKHLSPSPLPLEATPPAKEPPASLALMPFGTQSKLDVGEREKLICLFETNYPGVALVPETIPALQFLHCIQHQCQQKAWAWVPWRRVLSEAALLDMQGRKASVKRRDFAELVAEAAGLCSEELDLELSGSPHRIFQLLSTRAHAYALVAVVTCTIGRTMSTASSCIILGVLCREKCVAATLLLANLVWEPINSGLIGSTCKPQTKESV